MGKNRKKKNYFSLIISHNCSITTILYEIITILRLNRKNNDDEQDEFMNNILT